MVQEKDEQVLDRKLEKDKKAASHFQRCNDVDLILMLWRVKPVLKLSS